MDSCGIYMHITHTYNSILFFKFRIDVCIMMRVKGKQKRSNSQVFYFWQMFIHIFNNSCVVVSIKSCITEKRVYVLCTTRTSTLNYYILHDTTNFEATSILLKNKNAKFFYLLKVKINYRKKEKKNQ